jgi:hypothetical protein
MLLYIFDIVLSPSLGNVDGAYCFEQAEWN